MLPSRRDFLVTAGSFALAAPMGSPARAAMGPNDKFDLVIKGGDVLDPSQSLRARRDIGIRHGVIEAVEGSIPAERALRTLDASGKLVTPGPPLQRAVRGEVSFGMSGSRLDPT
jgi:dihydroorotase